MTTTTSRITKAQYAALEDKLNAAMELIAQLTAAQATTTAQTTAAATPALRSNSNTLGSKTFGRSILELVRVDQDWRTDEEFARGVILSNKEMGARARAWAFSRRNFWATKFDCVAMSGTEFVAPASGAWPTDHSFELNGETFNFTFGPKVVGTFIAIY